ncbi:MAG: translation elongation factor-like protein [Methanomicrobia archaeon]|nr:translation elongation factor-like protein [Methanomicrobia archaeon]HDM23254.1 translation elongation factor-like protein [Methanomicrobia archaeon]
MEEVGEVFTYFSRVGVAGIKVTGNFKVGDKIKIGDLEFVIDSMEIDRKKVEEAKPGDSVGIKTPEKVKKGEKVYRL